VALVEQPLLEELRERPPHALDVALVEGHVGIRQVHPEADLVGELLPSLGVAEDALDAAVREGLDAVALDVGLAVDLQLLLDLDLDRQPVGVPPGLPGHVVALHGLEAREDVLHRAREHVPVVGHPVRRRRALVEDVRPLARPGAARLGPEALLEDPVRLPEREDLRLVPGKIEVGADGSEAALAIVRHGRAFVARPRRSVELRSAVSGQRVPRDYGRYFASTPLLIELDEPEKGRGPPPKSTLGPA
jgi:hypothetical protein